MTYMKKTFLIIEGAVFLLLIVALVAFILIPKESPTAGDDVGSATLSDGKTYPIGVFRDAPLSDGKRVFSAGEFGIAFEYPSEYLLFEHEGDTTGESDFYHNFNIVSEGPALETIARAEAGLPGEGPPSVAITFYNNPDNYSPAQWVREANSAYTNYHAEDRVATLASTTVDGVPAIAYSSSYGLYASDYVAFAHGKWIVVVSGAREVADIFNFVVASIAL